MTTKQAFTSSEWDQVLMGPPSAGVVVIVAQRGGTWRETLSMGKGCFTKDNHDGWGADALVLTTIKGGQFRSDAK